MLQMIVMEIRIGSTLHCNFQMIVVAVGGGGGGNEINWCFGGARKASFGFEIINWEI